MANTFNRLLASSVTDGSTIGTVAAGKQWVVIGFQIANVAETTYYISVTAGGNNIIGANTPLPAGSAIGPLDGKLVLNAGDTITENGAVDNAIDYTISYMEMDV